MREYMMLAAAGALLLAPVAADARSQQDQDKAAAQEFSAKEQAMLDSLPYNMRSYVVSRMGPEQRLPELVETTLLNRMANPDYKALRNVVVVYRAEAQRPSGDWVAVEIDPVTYAVLYPVPQSTAKAADDSKAGQATRSDASR